MPVIREKIPPGFPVIWKRLIRRDRKNVITDHCTSCLCVRNNTSMWQHTKLSTDKSSPLDLVLPSSARWSYTICTILQLFFCTDSMKCWKRRNVFSWCHSSWKLTRLSVLKTSNPVSFQLMRGIYLMSYCLLAYFSLLPLTMHYQVISHFLHNAFRGIWAAEAIVLFICMNYTFSCT